MRVILGLVLFVVSVMAQAATHCDGTTYEINQCLIKAVKQADTDLVSMHHLSGDKVVEFKKQRTAMCKWMAKDITGTYSGVYYGHCELSLTQWYVDNLGP